MKVKLYTYDGAPVACNLHTWQHMFTDGPHTCIVYEGNTSKVDQPFEEVYMDMLDAQSPD